MHFCISRTLPDLQWAQFYATWKRRFILLSSVLYSSLVLWPSQDRLVRNKKFRNCALKLRHEAKDMGHSNSLSHSTPTRPWESVCNSWFEPQSGKAVSCPAHNLHCINTHAEQTPQPSLAISSDGIFSLREEVMLFTATSLTINKLFLILRGEPPPRPPLRLALCGTHSSFS